MVHPSDGEAWKYFDDMHPDKAREARNVRVAFATDGFNPYGTGAAPYTCWSVFVIPLNLSPGVMFEQRILVTWTSSSSYLEPVATGRSAIDSRVAGGRCGDFAARREHCGRWGSR